MFKRSVRGVRSLILAAALLVATVPDLLSPQSASGEEKAIAPAALTVRAFIDGRSQLIVQGDAVHWHHLDFAAPGRWLEPGSDVSHSEPTYLNGVAWYPIWPGRPDKENRDCGCDSSSTSVVPPLAQQNQTVTADIEQARGALTFVQQPEAGNDYTLIVEFDDGGPGGADWYEVVLHYVTAAAPKSGESGSGPGEFKPPTGVAGRGEVCTYGGPYEVDEHTLLLLHLDGSYAGAQGEPGTAAGTSFGPGRYSQGVLADDGDSLTYAATGKINLSQGAIEFWVRPNWDGNNKESYVFLEVGKEWFNRMRIMKDGADNLRFMLWDSSSETGIAHHVGDWRASEWHHVGVTWRGTEIALYVDGEQVESSSQANLPDRLAATISIGTGQGSDSHQADATIDELRISDVPRLGNSLVCGRALVAHGQTVTTPKDTPADITLTASSPEGRPLIFAVVDGPSHGILVGTVPSLVYRPDSGFVGSDAFIFRVSDGQHDAEVATVSLTVGLPAGFAGDCAGPNLLRNGDFEAGFDDQGVGLGWGAFNTEGGAAYGFQDDRWSPAVYDGLHSQLVAIGTDGIPPAVDRFAGIYQTVTRLEPGALYELSVSGLMREESPHPGEDPYRYQVQWAYSSQGHQDWTQVAGWQNLPWNEVSTLTDPGAFSTYTARLVAPSEQLTLFLRAWKKWASSGRELDVNLDGIALRRCGSAAAVEPSCDSWDLAHDLRVSPDQEDANRDSYGHRAVWHFMQGVSGQHDPSGYTWLPSFTSHAFGIQGLEQWTSYYAGSSEDVNPAIGINTTDQTQSSGTLAWPPHAVRVHPADMPVVVGWRSPVSGQVRITGLIRDMDGHCGNGVLWSIDLGRSTLASGSLANGEAQGFADGLGGARLRSVSVSEGEFVYFVVDPNGECGCDSTQLDIRIESTSCPASALPTQAATSTTWQRQSPPVSPSPRCCMGLVYDSARSVVVAVGGGDWTQLSNETWEYDGTKWTLRTDLRKPAPVRWTAAVAYNPDEQVTLLFGGKDESIFYNDTWQYDGRTWVRLSTLNPPSPRNGAKMAYDRSRHRMVLFGGYYGPDNVFFDQTWEYEDGRWTQRFPAHHPPARESSALVYDARRGVVVLFGGGQAAGSTVYGDTWEWDGNDWTQRLDLAASPPARWAHNMTYDEGRQRTVLFGGLTGTTSAFDDTWEYDGQTWVQVTASPRPSARWDPGLAYDLLNGRTVLFGGMGWDGQFGWSGDTWHYAP